MNDEINWQIAFFKNLNTNRENRKNFGDANRKTISIQNIDFVNIEKNEIRKTFKTSCENVANEINKTIECETNEMTISTKFETIDAKMKIKIIIWVFSRGDFSRARETWCYYRI